MLKRLSTIASVIIFSFPFSVLASDINVLEALLRNGQQKEVIQKIESNAAKTPEHYNLLVSAYMESDLDDAEKAAERGIKAFPQNYEMFLMHASVMGAQASDSIFSALGYAEKALNSLNKAVELAPKNIQTLSALMTFHIAAPAIVGGDIKEAQKLVDRISEVDPIEGQFSQAILYSNDDKRDDALALLNALSENEASSFRAHYQLANMYTSEEDYIKANEHYLKITEMTIEPPADLSDADLVEEYESAQWRQLQANYSIGRNLVNAEIDNNIEMIEQGINAMQTFITLLDNADFSTSGLPSKSWAKLRLAQLQLNAKRYDEAKATFASIDMEDEKPFKKIHKKLKRSLNKV